MSIDAELNMVLVVAVVGRVASCCGLPGAIVSNASVVGVWALADLHFTTAA